MNVTLAPRFRPRCSKCGRWVSYLADAVGLKLTVTSSAFCDRCHPPIKVTFKVVRR
jgi:hypothetical protein